MVLTSVSECTWDESLWCGNSRPLTCLANASSCSALCISSTTWQNFQPVDTRIYLIRSNSWCYHCAQRKKGMLHASPRVSWANPVMVRKQGVVELKRFSHASSVWIPRCSKNRNIVQRVLLSWPFRELCSISWVIHKALLGIWQCSLALQ